MDKFGVGDYVVATKWKDGHAHDQFCVGIYNGYFFNSPEKRHLVIDLQGENFRHNGIRRVQRVSINRGEWIIRNFPLIESYADRFKVWHWVRATWKELNRMGK